MVDPPPASIIFVHHLIEEGPYICYSGHFRQFGGGHFDALLVCSFKGLLNLTVCP